MTRHRRPASGPTGDYISIYSVPPGAPICVRLLAPARGVLFHWQRKTGVPCPGDECPRTTHAGSKVWKGFSPGLLWMPEAAHWLPILLETTESADEAMRGHAARGDTWLLSRAEQLDAHSQVIVSWVELYSGELPMAWDVFPILVRRYRTQAIAIDIVNPLPPRIAAIPHQAPPPVGLPLLQPYQLAVPPPPPPPKSSRVAKAFAAAAQAAAAPETPPTPEQVAAFRAQLRGLGREAAGDDPPQAATPAPPITRPGRPGRDTRRQG